MELVSKSVSGQWISESISKSVGQWVISGSCKGIRWKGYFQNPYHNQQTQWLFIELPSKLISESVSVSEQLVSQLVSWSMAKGW